MPGTDRAQVHLKVRPRARDNAPFLVPLSVIAAVFVAAAVVSHAWTRGLTQTAAWAVLVFGFGVLPWSYVLTQELLVDDDSIAVRRGLVRRSIRRSDVRRVVGSLGRILILGSGGKILLSLGRYWSDEQLRAVCDVLGLKAEGTAKYLHGPL